jgi:anti-sigma B factor antagonist
VSGACHPVSPFFPPQVIAIPDEIDMNNSGLVGDSLRAAFGSAPVVVADLTCTTYCDTSGARTLLVASQEAAAASVELRVALPDGHVRQMLRLTGLDQLLRIYPTVAEALIT